MGPNECIVRQGPLLFENVNEERLSFLLSFHSDFSIIGGIITARATHCRVNSQPRNDAGPQRILVHEDVSLVRTLAVREV